MPRKKGKIKKHSKPKITAPALSSSNTVSSETFSEGQVFFLKAEKLMNQLAYNALQLLINDHIDELPPEEALYLHLARHMFFDARFESQARMESEEVLKKHFKKIQKQSNEICRFAFHYIDILIEGRNRPDEAFKKLGILAKQGKATRILWLQLRALPLYLETTTARVQTQLERYHVLFEKAEPLYHELIEKHYLFAHLAFFEIYLILPKGDMPLERKYYNACCAQAMELGHYSYILVSLQAALQIKPSSNSINTAKRMYDTLLRLDHENKLSWGGIFCLACIGKLLLESDCADKVILDFIKHHAEAVEVLFERALEQSHHNPALYSQTLLYYAEILASEALDSPHFSQKIWKVIEVFHQYKNYLPYHFSLNVQKGNAIQRYAVLLLSLYQAEHALTRKHTIRNFLHELHASFDEANLFRSTKKQLRQILSNPLPQCENNPDPAQNEPLWASSENDVFISEQEWRFLQTGEISDLMFENAYDYYIEAVFLYSQEEKVIFAIWQSAFIAFAQKSTHAACLIGCLLMDIIALSCKGQNITPYLETLQRLFVEQGVLIFSGDQEAHPIFLDLYTSLLIFLVINKALSVKIESIAEEMDESLIPHMWVGVGDFNSGIEAQLDLLLQGKILRKDIFHKFLEITKNILKNITQEKYPESDIAMFTYRDLQSSIVSFFLKKLQKFSFDEKYYPITASYQACCLAFSQPLENPLTQTPLRPVYQAASFGLTQAKKWLIENTPLEAGELILQDQACKLLHLATLTEVFGFQIEEAALRIQEGNIVEKYIPPAFWELMIIAYAISLCPAEGINFSVLKCQVDGHQGTLEVTPKIIPSQTYWDTIRQYQGKISEKREFISGIVRNIICFVGKITLAMASPLQEANFTFHETHISFVSKCKDFSPELFFNKYDSLIQKKGSLFYAKLSIQHFLRDPEIVEFVSDAVAATLSFKKAEMGRVPFKEEFAALQALSLFAEAKSPPREASETEKITLPDAKPAVGILNH